MPTPRFSKSVRSVPPARFNRPPTSSSGRTVTTIESISDVTPGGEYLIRGIPTPTRVATQFSKGDLVYVVWKKGKPFMILNMSTRRGPGTDEPFGDENIVEVLFIAPDENGLMQIWFQNSTLVSNLKLRALLPDDPVEVKWGARADSFFVRTGSSLYHTFKFSRSGIDVAMTSAPKPKLLRTAEDPSVSTLRITRLTYSATATLLTPSIWNEDTINIVPFGEGDSTTIFAGGAATTLSRSDSATRVSDLRLMDGVSIMDAQLDWKYNLILSVQYTESSGWLVPPSGVATQPATRDYNRFEQPPGNVVSESGDPSAYSHQCVLNGPGTDWAAAPVTAGDFHAAVVNFTEGRVLWNTASATAAINYVFQSRSRVARATMFTKDEDFSGVTESTHQVAAAQDHGTTFEPNFGNPSTDPLASNVEVALAENSSGSNAFFDRPGLAFLNLPAPYDGPNFTRVSSIYSHNMFGSAGDQDSASNLYLKYAVSEDSVRRGNRLRFYPLAYRPHRTKDLGDLFFFVGCTALASDANSNPTAQYNSIWKYSLDTKIGVPIMNWTTESMTTGQSPHPFSLDVSLRHALLWVRTNFSIGPTQFERLRVLLAGQTGPTTGASKLLSDETRTDPGAIPPLFLKFFKNDWNLPRPDLLYILEGTISNVKNQFIAGWSPVAITLDPVKPKLETKLRGKGVLKKIPASVVPISGLDETGVPITNGPRPSVRVLESASALGSLFLRDS